MLGTDIAAKGPEHGPARPLQQLVPARRERRGCVPYLLRTRGGYRVVDAIRKRVTFATLNLAVDAYPSFKSGTWGMDLILCRNVLIYLDRTTVANVARRLFECLSEGGWLMTASSDPPLWDLRTFEVVATPQGIFYRKLGDKKADLLAAWDQERAADDGDVAQITPVYAKTPGAAVGHVGEAGAAAALPQPALSPGSPLRLLANQDPARALAECGHMLADQPFSTELNYWHAVLLMDAGTGGAGVRGDAQGNLPGSLAGRRPLHVGGDAAAARRSGRGPPWLPQLPRSVCRPARRGAAAPGRGRTGRASGGTGRRRTGISGGRSMTSPQESARAILEERARHLAQVPPQTLQAAEVIEVLIFALGTEKYAVETDHLREVLRWAIAPACRGRRTFCSA